MTSVLNVLFEERLGGPQWRVLQVARGLRKCGMETMVVLPRGDPKFASLLRAADIPFRELELVRPRRTWNPLAHLRFLALFGPNVAALRRVIREGRVDVVHTNVLMNLQAVVAAKLEGVPLVWHLNDTSTPWPLRKAVVPLVKAWADRIAISSQAVGRYYGLDRARWDGRVRVLYPPVDLGRFHPRVDGSGVRAELGVSNDSPVVGTVANICPGKGLEFLLEAAPAIRRRRPDTKFLIVGRPLENRRGYWSALIRRRAELGLEKDVIFAGSRHDIPEVMRAMTVYVHPSDSESGPMVVLEAGASGLPVVATRVGGTPEVVADGETGILIEPRSPAQIASAVIRLLDSPHLARRMGLAGVERMRKLFSLEACVAEHARIYTAALKPRSARQASAAGAPIP